PTWLYPRHTDAVRPLRTQGAHNIRTRGSLPHERSHIRTWLSIAHHQFSACRSGGVHIRIYDCIYPEVCWSIREPLTARAGPYMPLNCHDGLASSLNLSQFVEGRRWWP